MSAETAKSHEEQKVNAENWRGHEEQLNQIFSLYTDKINAMVAVYNSVTGEFPIGVLNELRDIFSHMAQSLLADDPETISRQLGRAQSHCKRAAVDSFKYAATAYSRIYDDFKKTYQHVDLSYIDNGQFLPKLTKLHAEAGQLMTKARLIEADVHTDDQMYEAYEDAFNCYLALYECIMDAIAPAETFRLKAEEDQKDREEKERKATAINKASLAFGVIGVIVGIIGIAVNFL